METVTSIILGYWFYETPMGGAPKATVIVVKVLKSDGWGWESFVAAGILCIAGLKDVVGAEFLLDGWKRP